MADEPFDVSLRDLRHLSSHLNDLTDRAAQTVQDVEKFLDSCNIGIEVSVPIINQEIGADANKDIGHLEYRIVGRNRQSRIMVRDSSTNDVRAWSECTRDLKIKSIGALPELIRSLTSVVTHKLTEAERALEKVSQLLSHSLEREEQS
jgi:hypothetical protein